MTGHPISQINTLPVTQLTAHGASRTFHDDSEARKQRAEKFI